MSRTIACTSEHPCTDLQDLTRQWFHPDSQEVGEQEDDYDFGTSYQDYECPNCGIKFTVELPQ